jgi:hypothetical protein
MRTDPEPVTTRGRRPEDDTTVVEDDTTVVEDDTTVVEDDTTVVEDDTTDPVDGDVLLWADFDAGAQDLSDSPNAVTVGSEVTFEGSGEGSCGAPERWRGQV